MLGTLPVTLPSPLDLPVLSATAEAATSVSFNIFFSTLQPYGRWVRYPEYNYVWVPTKVDRQWAPYTNGHWVYTDRYGWFFASDEPFASIVYHYGRWGYDNDIGWFWVPGNTWAPAWVAWRRDDRNVGWAPLPPEHRGYAVNVSITININAIPRDRWYFVESHRFLDPHLSTVVVSGDRDEDMYRRTRPLGPVVVQNNIVVNNVIELNFIQKQTDQKVEVHHVKQVDSPDRAGSNGQQGDVAAFIASIGQPSDNEKPKDAIDKQQAAKEAPPTRGTKAEAAPANAENGQPACMDTDPKTEGCQPASNNAANQGKQPSSGEASAADKANTGAQGQGNAQGEQPCVDTDPKAEGCQPAANNAANQGKQPPATQGSAAAGADKKNAAEGKGNAENGQQCVDTDPNTKGCQPVSSNAEAAPPKGGNGKANESNGPSSEQTGSINRQEQPACKTDADPTKPGCQQAGENVDKNGAPNEQGSASPNGGDKNQGTGRGNGQNQTAQDGNGNSAKPAGSSSDKGGCKVDVDPNKPGCQQPPAGK
jgi:hypothetical protein